MAAESNEERQSLPVYLEALFHTKVIPSYIQYLLSIYCQVSRWQQAPHNQRDRSFTAGAGRRDGGLGTGSTGRRCNSEDT